MSLMLNPIFEKYKKLINQKLNEQLSIRVDADQSVIDILVQTLTECINYLLDKIKIEISDQICDENRLNKNDNSSFMAQKLYTFTNAQRRIYAQSCIDLERKCDKKIQKYIKSITKTKKQIIATRSKEIISVIPLQANAIQMISQYMKNVHNERDKIKVQLQQKLDESLQKINDFAQNKNIIIPSFTKIEYKDRQQTDNMNMHNLDMPQPNDDTDSIMSDSSRYSFDNNRNDTVHTVKRNDIFTGHTSNQQNKLHDISLETVLLECDELIQHNNNNEEREELNNVSTQNDITESEELMNYNTGDCVGGDLINSIGDEEISHNIFCICKRKLIITNSSDLSSTYNVINCDKCNAEIKLSIGTNIYHCSARSRKHPDGYDLCMQCANNINHEREIQTEINDTNPVLCSINDNSALSNDAQNANASQEINNKNNHSNTRKRRRKTRRKTTKTTTKKTTKKKFKGRKNFSCYHCGETFEGQKEFKSHNKNEHNDDKPYHCDRTGCNLSYNTKHRCNAHIYKIHENKINYKCEYCGKGFYYKGDLKKHLRTHTGEKPFECDECNKAFNLKGNLQKHIDAVHRNIRRRHSGEKPHKCEYCNKSFIQSCNLTRHIRIHTGEKPFECRVCHRRFNDQGNRKKHEQTMHKRNL